MQKNTNPTSAFFQLRVATGLFVFLSGIFLALLGAGSFTSAVAQQSRAAKSAATEPAAAVRAEQPAAQGQFSPADKEGRFVYLIEFAEPGLLQRQVRLFGEQFDPHSARSQSQIREITAEQAGHVQGMDRALGRSVNPTHHYVATHSGIAARLSPNEAELVRSLPGVKSVERERLYQLDTFEGPNLIGAPSIWDGTAVPGGMGTRGAGTVIGVIDSGIIPTHPSYADDPTCGHGTGGVPAKLLSAIDCSSKPPGQVCNGPNPVDADGHGTHTSSTAGGNRVTTSANPPPQPPQPYTSISGVAPCASIRSYRVCFPTGCTGAAIDGAWDSVILHGDVRVANYSITTDPPSPWVHDIRMLNATDANVIIAQSAGNTNAANPTPTGAIRGIAPWVMNVAASTRDGDASGILSATGPGTPPANTQNIPATKGSGSPNGMTMTDTPIRHFTGQPSTAEGCTAGEDTAPPDLAPFPPGFFNGAIALIHRGNCPFTKKIQNAFNAGAIGVIIRNNAAGALSMSTPGQPNIPAYSIDQASGNALVAFVDDNPSTATATLQINPIPADVLAGFSLRGPTRSPWQDLQKPDITGPGVSIYAAYIPPNNYANVSGTSMSSPHLAGAMALVRTVRPTWSPAEVKSAVMMTAKKAGFKEDQTTPWDTDDVGSGRVDLTRAARAGLVMNETTLRFLNANPDTGGDVKTLNLPSMRNLQCSPHCIFKRTVRNTLTTPANWTATAVPGAAGYNLTVSPSSFSFNGGLLEQQELTITAIPTSNISTGPVRFGEIVLSENASQAPNARMTVAIRGEQLVVSAVSRKVHGAGGPFDIPLPLLGPTGIESREGSTPGTHQIVVTFTSPVTFTGVSVVEGGGTAVATPLADTVVITLTNVPDARRVVVRLTGTSNGMGTTSATVDIPFRTLVGDVNGDGTVNAVDIGLTKAHGVTGTVNASTFRADFNADNAINAVDISNVKAKSGNTVPAGN